MLVRCERCRAVFRHSTPTHAVFLECSRCHHVFPVPTAELEALEPQGTLGGAAAIALSARQAPPAPIPPGITARPPRTSQSPVTVTLLALVVGALALVALRSPGKSPPLTATTNAIVRSSEALVRLDDEASLETALAQLTTAAAAQPDNTDVRARRAFVLLLLGATLRAESDDLLAELSRSVPTPEGLAALSETERAASLQRAAHAREQLPVLTARSDDLVRDGIALAHDAAQPGPERTGAQQRALFLAEAFDHRLERLQVPPQGKAGDRDYAQLVAWWHFARATGADSTAAAEKELTAALASDPSCLRAKWMLARLLAAKTPPDQAAERLLNEVLGDNPRHTGAARDKSRIAVPPVTALTNFP